MVGRIGPIPPKYKERDGDLCLLSRLSDKLQTLQVDAVIFFGQCSIHLLLSTYTIVLMIGKIRNISTDV